MKRKQPSKKGRWNADKDYDSTPGWNHFLKATAFVLLTWTDSGKFSRPFMVTSILPSLLLLKPVIARRWRIYCLFRRKNHSSGSCFSILSSDLSGKNFLFWLFNSIVYPSSV